MSRAPAGQPELPAHESQLPDGAAASSLRAYIQSQPKHGSTTDMVTDAMREAILDGVIPAATWLREEELARHLQVSRTPVREALKRLADEHLVIRMANRGCIVPTMSRDEMTAIYLVREALEGLAAYTVAASQPPGLLDQLLAVHHAMADELERRDVSALERLNKDFHRIIRRRTGNSYLIHYLDQIEGATRRFGGTNYADPERAREAHAEHHQIIMAIINADPVLAQNAATTHVRRARVARIARSIQFDNPQQPAADRSGDSTRSTDG